MFRYLKLLFEHSSYLITMPFIWICVMKDRHGMVLKVFEIQVQVKSLGITGN